MGKGKLRINSFHLIEEKCQSCIYDFGRFLFDLYIYKLGVLCLNGFSSKQIDKMRDGFFIF
jgi:hypothetical protein